MKVVVAGGGTAGHVFPALAVAEVLRDRGVDVEWFGSAEGQEARLVPDAGYPFRAIEAQKMARELSLATLKAPFVALSSARSVRPLLEGTDVVLSLGGYTSAPVVLAARSARASVVLVEPNAIPGLANRLLARRADAIAVTFEEARRRFPGRSRVVVTGTPVRDAILAAAADPAGSRAESQELFGLDPARRTVGVFGGSQGALSIDRAVAGMLGRLSDRADLQLLIAAGDAHREVVAAAVDPAAALLVQVHGFIERMDLALAATDLVVSRAGGSVAEVAVCGRPSILIPYPHAAENHQEANARELEANGAAEVLLDRDLSPDVLARSIDRLISDPDRLRQMSERARGWARPDAAERLADLVREVAA